MDKLFEVNYTIFDDANQMSYSTNLANLRMVVQATCTDQAQAMVEAQYGARVKVWSVVQK